jgi:hypothetical protein
VHLEVALEVEDRDLLGLRGAEQLAKRGIRVDVLLVVEFLLLDVGHDAARHIGAAHLRALGLAKEHAKVVRDLLGLREDRLLLGKGVARLIKRRRPSAATAAGLLELAGKALLSLLHVGKHGRERGAEVVDLRDVRGKLGDKVHLLLRGGGGRGGRRHNGGGDRRGRGRSGRRGGGLATRRGHRGRRGGYGNGGNRGGGLLGDIRGLLVGAHLILVAGLVLWVF